MSISRYKLRWFLSENSHDTSKLQLFQQEIDTHSLCFWRKNSQSRLGAPDELTNCGSNWTNEATSWWPWEVEITPWCSCLDEWDNHPTYLLGHVTWLLKIAIYIHLWLISLWKNGDLQYSYVKVYQRVPWWITPIWSNDIQWPPRCGFAQLRYHFPAGMVIQVGMSENGVQTPNEIAI